MDGAVGNRVGARVRQLRAGILPRIPGDMAAPLSFRCDCIVGATGSMSNALFRVLVSNSLHRTWKVS